MRDRDKSYLLGLGLDCDDGHIRVTKGENFKICGGSHRTHEQMQERVMKFNEKLSKRGKTLDDVSMREFFEIADSVGLNTIKAKRKGKQ